jgi:hypothetical protein
LNKDGVCPHICNGTFRGCSVRGHRPQQKVLTRPSRYRCNPVCMMASKRSERLRSLSLSLFQDLDLQKRRGCEGLDGHEASPDHPEKKRKSVKSCSLKRTSPSGNGVTTSQTPVTTRRMPSRDPPQSSKRQKFVEDRHKTSTSDGTLAQQKRNQSRSPFILDDILVCDLQLHSGFSCLTLSTVIARLKTQYFRESHWLCAPVPDMALEMPMFGRALDC